MLNDEWLMLLIPGLPLLAAVVTGATGRFWPHDKSHWPAAIAVPAAFVCSLLLLWNVYSDAVATQSAERTAVVEGPESIDGPATSAQQVATPAYPKVLHWWTWAKIPGAYLESLRPTRFLPGVQSGTTAPQRYDLDLSVVTRVDALTAIMLATVTFVGSLVVIYSIGYMHADPGYGRFFAFVSLFVFSMTMLVSASNFLVLFVFWEAVGVCSYLLIGFWFTKPSAAAAGMKAFLVNRIGDLGLIVAIFLIWLTFGTVDFHDTPVSGTGALWSEMAVPADTPLAHVGVFGQSRLQDPHGYRILLPFTVSIICLMLFLGACGKSAQFPLHVWLPDAMEGPTPVSALIHAATMVTAGVYLVTRCSPLFVQAPAALLAVAAIGTFTALLAGLIALTQTDLKRVLAYSTVSQLGFMFMGLGAGTVAGIAGGMFHLFTHAFFKALLFLGAGSVMHAMGGVIDMTRFSGLKKIMPWTYATFAIGSLALAGFPLLSGFWSKDEILAALYEQAPTNGTIPAWLLSPYGMCFTIGCITAWMTAFYTFRAFFLTFHGPEKIPHEAGHHAHESPPVMTAPLVILAVLSLFVGIAVSAFDSTNTGGRILSFREFLQTTPSLRWVADREQREKGRLAIAQTRNALASTTGGEIKSPAPAPAPAPTSASVPAPETTGHSTSGHEEHAQAHDHGHGHHLFVQGLSALIALTGIGLAAFLYLGDWKELSVVDSALRPLQHWSQQKFYLDELYLGLIVWPLLGIAKICAWFDPRLVDGLVDTIGQVPAALGWLCRPLGRGQVQFYGLMMVVGILVLLIVGQVSPW